MANGRHTAKAILYASLFKQIAFVIWPLLERQLKTTGSRHLHNEYFKYANMEHFSPFKWAVKKLPLNKHTALCVQASQLLDNQAGTLSYILPSIQSLSLLRAFVACSDMFLTLELKTNRVRIVPKCQIPIRHLIASNAFVFATIGGVRNLLYIGTDCFRGISFELTSVRLPQTVWLQHAVVFLCVHIPLLCFGSCARAWNWHAELPHWQRMQLLKYLENRASNNHSMPNCEEQCIIAVY